MSDFDWIIDEFSNVDFGDKRINDRFIKTASSLGHQPGLSANKACDDWASCKAAYRFFDNEKVNPDEILRPHIENTFRRAESFPFILAIQDTSSINFTDHNAKKDFGDIGIGDPNPESKNAKGLFVHPTLAVSPQGQPLGIINNFFWKRGEKTEDKESDRWIKSLEKTYEITKGKQKILSIADREADFNEFFLAHVENEAHFILRSKMNRKIIESGQKLHEFIKEKQISLTYEIEVQNKKGKNNRQVKKRNKGRFKNLSGSLTRIAKLNIQFSQVNIILDSGHRNRADIDFPVTVIRVFESPRPLEEGEYLIEWFLLTSIKIKDVEQAKLMVDFYSMRWRIEEFFKILKSGCKIEDSRFETYERTIRFIALNLVIAWRVFYMTHLLRTEPNEPCTSFLTENEWKTLYCKTHKTKKIPIQPPTVNEAITWISMLGGFLNRNSDGNPGNQSIWIGFKRLNDMVSMWEILT